MTAITVDIHTREEITLDLETAAAWFASLDDIQQAKWLELVEDEFQKFDAEGQAYHIGKQASTKARNFVFRLGNTFACRGLGGKNWTDAVNRYEGE